MLDQTRDFTKRIDSCGARLSVFNSIIRKQDDISTPCLHNVTGCGVMLRAHGVKLRFCSTVETIITTFATNVTVALLPRLLEARNQTNNSDCGTFINEIINVLFNQYSNILKSTYI